MTSTVISLLPFASEENKPSLVPPIFHLEAAKSLDEPSFTVIPDGQFIEYIPLKGPRLNNISGETIAKSIVNDKLTSMFGRDLEKKALPGLAFVVGEFRSLKAFNEKNEAVYREVKANHLRWYENLVVLADDDWTKYKQHRLITDLQRYAARALQLEREWLIEIAVEKSARCPYCQEIINKGAIKCMHCGEVLDSTKYTALKK